jgi:hypothetical protein
MDLPRKMEREDTLDTKSRGTAVAESVAEQHMDKAITVAEITFVLAAVTIIVSPSIIAFAAYPLFLHAAGK